MKVVDLFHISRGHGYDLNKLEPVPHGGVNYVSCTGRNNGVLSRVNVLDGAEPAPAGTLSAALVGATCATFLQTEPWYGAQNTLVLTPRQKMSETERLWWATCIRANDWRFNYGRKANRTFAQLDLPDTAPPWVAAATVPDYGHLSAPIQDGVFSALSTNEWLPFRVNEIFEVTYGHSLELNRLTPQADGINFVSRTSQNNGVSARVAPLSQVQPTPGGTLSVALGGSVLETFLQPVQWYAGYHVAVLTPLQQVSEANLLFVAALLRRERYRYNYGRQANRTLAGLTLRLPVTPAGDPDWTWIDLYMSRLRWSHGAIA